MLVGELTMQGVLKTAEQVLLHIPEKTHFQGKSLPDITICSALNKLASLAGLSVFGTLRNHPR